MVLSGKNIVITGASCGLGRAIAVACWREGASVLLAARSQKALDELRVELAQSRVNSAQKAELLTVDLSKQNAAEVIVNKALSLWPRADALINNAGILGPIGPAWENNWDEWKATLDINLCAPVELCRAFVPWFLQNGGGSIINLSGGGATGPRPNFSAYATAKTGLVRFTEILAVELKGTGVRANSIAPGAMATDMLKEIVAAGAEKVGADEYAKIMQLAESGGTPPEKAAALCVFLASDAAREISGRLISAAWDPWEQIAPLLAELNASDIYTLRRIVPEDRGKKW